MTGIDTKSPAAVPASDAGKAPQPLGEDHGTPGEQTRPMTEDEKLDTSLEDTFPTSDPVPPSQIDDVHT